MPIHHVKRALSSPVVLSVAAVFALLVAGTAGAWFWLLPAPGDHADTMLRGVHIGGMPVSGMTRDVAVQSLQDRFSSYRMNYTLQDASVTVNPNDVSAGPAVAAINARAAAEQAYAIGRAGNPAQRLWGAIRAVAVGTDISLRPQLNRVALRTVLEREFADDIDLAKDATVRVTVTPAGKATAQAVEGEAGTIVDFDAVMTDTEARLDDMSELPVRLRTMTGAPDLSVADVTPLLHAAETATERAPLNLTAKGEGWTISAQTLGDWITVSRVNGHPTLTLDRAKTDPYLAARAKTIASQPKDAEFEEKDGKVVTFVPAVNGATLDIDASVVLIAEAAFGAPLADGEPRPTSIALPLKEVEPEITTEKSNPYGIKELIGVGASNFRGSPANRRHNIAVGAASVNGTLVMAGAEFSMMQTLGAIDGTTGYRQELVIKGNETKPEYGGGLCQIGSTAFRGALASGLDITERRNHSYRVPYYERDGDGNYIGPGKDATLYDPAPDFKFKNDTGHAILITSKITGDKVEFFFWGVRDGRTAEQTDARVFNIVPPPEKKVVETDTLPPGEERCTEKPHVGSDAVFTYTVTYADGTKKEKEFFSRYRPWQEVCLVGKDPNAPPTDPAAAPSPDGSTPSLDAVGADGT